MKIAFLVKNPKIIFTIGRNSGIINVYLKSR